MRMVNGVLFAVIFVLFGIWFYGKVRHKKSKGQVFLQTHLYLLVILLAAIIGSFLFSFSQKKEQIYVQREDYYGEEKEIGFLLKNGEEEEEVSLTVHPRLYTEKEQKKKMEEAFHYLDEHIKGKNKSLSYVVDSIDISLDYERFPFQEEVRPDDYSLMDEEGNIRNEKSWLMEEGYSEKDLSKGIKTGVTIVLWYGEEKKEKYYEMTIFPKKKEGAEKLFSDVLEQIKQREKNTIYEEGFELPSVMEDVFVIDESEGGILPVHFIIFGFIICGLLLLKEKEEEKQKEQKRKDKLLRCYPWFVNEMVLMLGAGMQVKNIINLLITDYEAEPKIKVDDREPLIEELNIARQSLNMGMAEQSVYYQLGRRLKLSCYIKLMTLLEQNVKRGTKGLAAFFEQEETQALEERKNLAKRYGEEAGTKLLGPMMLLLLVIMLMIMIPAFMSFM
ncbi:MAG: type II secretion system F family protein [Clostridiales bacterium]|nr:type II secretion system F family protein [Clostridiales bacterium]